MAFKAPSKQQPNARDPEQLYRALPRANDAPKALWAHQADVLRRWHQEHLGSSDVALELPTGAGKTLVAGLIGEWWRREYSQPVAYLCPTRQLAQQTAGNLRQYGVATELLTGKAKLWDRAARARYDAGEAVAVSVYSHVFNSNPAIDRAGLLLLDDAHAAEGFVLSPWRLVIDRDDLAFFPVIDVLEQSLDPLVAERIRHGTDEQRAHDAYLAAPFGVSSAAGALETVLHDADSRSAISRDAHYAFGRIRSHLAACMAYVSYQKIEIRPLIAPTSTHPAFDVPRQRLYMSATLGRGGELERSFGRRQIDRIPIPEGWDRRGTGRRLFCFPSFTSDLSKNPAALEAWSTRTLDRFAKSTVLTPDNRTADHLESNVLSDANPVLRASDIEDDLDRFASAATGHLLLTNRYDGIDLPDDACRLVVMVGLPARGDLQERFFHDSLGAPEVLQERIRARVVQGAGRATRHEGDYAVVVLLGDDLTKFCSRREVQAAMHPDVHSELRFGFENSLNIDSDEMDDNIELFLKQDAEWKSVEEVLVASLDEVQSVDPAGSVELLRSARHEVEACDAIWEGDVEHALDRAHAVIEALRGGKAPQRFAAFWHYLAASWASRLNAAEPDGTFRAVSEEHYRKARKAGRGTTWLTHLASLADRSAAPDVATIDPIDETAANNIRLLVVDDKFPDGFENHTSRVRAGLLSRAKVDYEPALVEMGRLLGASDTVGDRGATAAPDAVWEFGDLLWVSWEAKSEAEVTSELGAKDVRQAGGHLRYHRDHVARPIPSSSIGLIVAPHERIHNASRAVAEDHLHLVRPAGVVEIYDRLLRGLRDVRSRASADLSVGEVLRCMELHAAAPSQWIPLLTSERLAATD